MFSATGLTPQTIAAAAATNLKMLRAALNECADLQAWLSGFSLTDLTTFGFTAEDAQDILSGVADANALAQLYRTGLPPGSYPQPPQAYVYGASQRKVIGP